MNFGCSETKQYSEEQQVNSNQQPNTEVEPDTKNKAEKESTTSETEPSASEKEVHSYLNDEFNKLEKSYQGTSQVPSEEEELKVVDKVANKFNLTRQQVLDIWDKIELQNTSLGN